MSVLDDLATWEQHVAVLPPLERGEVRISVDGRVLHCGLERGTEIDDPDGDTCFVSNAAPDWMPILDEHGNRVGWRHRTAMSYGDGV